MSLPGNYGFPTPKEVPGAYQPSSGGMAPLLVDSNGYLLVDVIAGGGSGGTSSTFGAAFPGTGTAVGGETTGGKMGPLLLDASGYLYVDIGAGSIVVAPVTSTTASSPGPTSVGTSSATALAANSNRKRLTIQNTGTTVLYVLFGAGSASSSNYHIILPAGGTVNDGSSHPYIDEMWQGAVQWASSASGGQGSAYENT
jgi:hypothetical protein